MCDWGILVVWFPESLFSAILRGEIINELVFISPGNAHFRRASVHDFLIFIK